MLCDQQGQAKSHLQVSVAAAATTMALMPEISLPRKIGRLNSPLKKSIFRRRAVLDMYLDFFVTEYCRGRVESKLAFAFAGLAARFFLLREFCFFRESTIRSSEGMPIRW